MSYVPLKKLLIVGVASIALSACDSGSNNDSETIKEKAAETTSSTKETMVEKAKELLKLDTSSLDSFKSSLSSMKSSLSSADASKLTGAIESLAKSTAKDSGGLMDAAKSMASGKSVEETVYSSLKGKLSGATFEDVLKLAN